MKRPETRKRKNSRISKKRRRTIKKKGGYETTSEGKIALKKTEVEKVNELLNNPNWGAYGSPEHRKLVVDFLWLTNHLNNLLQGPRFRGVILEKLNQIPYAYPDLNEEVINTIQYVRKFENPSQR